VDGQGNTATSSNQTFTTSSSTLTFATLDPSNTSANITLSNGNLTATCNTTNNIGNVSRTTTSHSTGKYYFEVTVVLAVGSVTQGIGVINSTESVTNNALGFSGTNSIGYFTSNGAYYLNSVHTGNFASATTGDVVGVAVDLTNNNIWWRTNAGNWNNSGTANPATNTGGQSISTLTGPLFAGIEADTVNGSLSVNFGATSYAFTPPTGFGNW
jgi:SPRY domain